MKHITVCLTSCLLLAVRIIWAYPVYRIGLNFQELVTSGQAQKAYVETDNTDNSVFLEKEVKPDERIKAKLFRCKVPYSIRLEDTEGNTLWKTSSLVSEQYDTFYFTNPDSEDVYFNIEGTCGGYEKRIAVDKNKEIQIGSYKYDDPDALLLYDAKDTKQRVLKKKDGSEVKLPYYLHDYELNFNNMPSLPAWVFIRCSERDPWNDGFLSEKPLGITVIDYDGNVRFSADTKNPVAGISELLLNQTLDRALLNYEDMDGKNWLLILGNKCSVERKYNNRLWIDDYDTFFPNVKEYCVLYKGDSEFYILDLRNGEIVAKIIGESLDLTQSGDTLIGVVGYGPMAAVIDIISGKLIQDLTDYNLCTDYHYTIPDVKISQAADEIWIFERYSQGSGKTRHFRLGIK